MKSKKTELKWALIFVITTLIWMTLERLLGYHDEKIDRHATISMLFMIPAITVYVLAFLDKRNKNPQNAFTYMHGFVFGLWVTLFVTLISPLTQYLTSVVISPDYFTNIIAYTVENNMMTKEAAEANFNLKSYLIQTAIATPIMGTATSAIVAIFTRKKSSNSL